MRKLFLASIVANTIEKLIEILPKLPNELTVAFIPTAADVYEDKWFIHQDLNKLKEKGFKVKEVNIKGKRGGELREELKDVDIIFVAGGNTFYLLEKSRESGFDKIVKELVSKGIVYVGSSAGAVLAGPNIELLKEFNDVGQAPGLDSFEGLCLIDFIILPHYGKEKYRAAYERTMKECKGLKVIPLTDKQAIIVEGEDYRMVG